MNKDLDNIISYIKNTLEYKNCIKIKKKMNNSHDVVTKIEEVKKLQKLYVKSNFSDEDIKSKLDLLENELNSIPIYNDYIRNLNKVNEMIDLVRNYINDYFDDILNN